MPTDFLTRIVASKQAALDDAKRARSYKQIRKEAIAIRASSEPHAFIKAFSRDRINVIAEFKRQSPSQGVIRNDVSPKTMARRYQAGGAAAISVLTEEHYFGGSLADLRAVRGAVSLPVLRKDFIFDEYQVFETAAAGADALLLIVAVLDKDALITLRRLAEDELGMDVLVEVHTGKEMQRATASGAKFVGVNNRSLKTLRVSLETSIKLVEKAPRGGVLISESGLDSPWDLRRLHRLGYKGFLIGEFLMRAETPEETLRVLIGE